MYHDSFLTGDEKSFSLRKTDDVANEYLAYDSDQASEDKLLYMAH